MCGRGVGVGTGAGVAISVTSTVGLAEGPIASATPPSRPEP